MADSSYSEFRAATCTPLLEKQKLWCEKRLENMEVWLSAGPIITWQCTKLNKSADYQGLTDSARCSASTSFMASTGRITSAAGTSSIFYVCALTPSLLELDVPVGDLLRIGHAELTAENRRPRRM